MLTFRQYLTEGTMTKVRSDFEHRVLEHKRAMKEAGIKKTRISKLYHYQNRSHVKIDLPLGSDERVQEHLKKRFVPHGKGETIKTWKSDYFDHIEHITTGLGDKRPHLLLTKIHMED